MYITYADIFRPTQKQARLLYDLTLVLAGSILIALSAQIAIHLPFSPVPITGQTFAVLFLAALLGSKRGTATVLTYIAQGAAGLPVFAGGTAGLPVLIGPTGGYLAGFVLAAYVVGRLAEKGWDRRVMTTVAMMVIGNIVIYATGVIWLGTIIGYRGAITVGLAPFIVGDLLKIALAALVLPFGWKVLKKIQ